jgi:hypothetical protein
VAVPADRVDKRPPHCRSLPVFNGRGGHRDSPGMPHL